LTPALQENTQVHAELMLQIRYLKEDAVELRKANDALKREQQAWHAAVARQVEEGGAATRRLNASMTDVWTRLEADGKAAAESREHMLSLHRADVRLESALEEVSKGTTAERAQREKSLSEVKAMVNALGRGETAAATGDAVQGAAARAISSRVGAPWLSTLQRRDARGAP